MIKVSDFGITRGVPVQCIRMENELGEYVELLDFGASIHAIGVRDENGQIDDVTLGAPDAAALDGMNMEGVVVGRCANRIADARFSIGDKEFCLEAGRGGHCLHSGSGNWATKHFDTTLDEAKNEVHFSYRDHGEGGFESALLAEVIYRFDRVAPGGRTRLLIEYRVTPEEDTVVAPTNHTYFNLGCEDVRDHVLMLRADRYAVKAESGVPDGRILPVDGTPLDFRLPRAMREAMEVHPETLWPEDNRAYDDCLLLEGSGMRKAGALYCRKNGRRMEVFTDMPALVLFTFAAPREVPGKNGELYGAFRSVCLETGYAINAVNCPAFDQPITRAGETFVSRTAYVFSAPSVQPLKKGRGFVPQIEPKVLDRIPDKLIDIPYASQSESQKLDLYYPFEASDSCGTGRNQEGKYPVIVYFHGGGFSLGDKQDEDLEPMLRALERGYVLVSANYRGSDEELFPAALDDAKAVIRFLRGNADRYRIDPDRIGVWGPSSGGWQVSMLGVTGELAAFEDLSQGNADQSSRVQAVLDWCGPCGSFADMDRQMAEAGFVVRRPHSDEHSPESRFLGIPLSHATGLCRLASPTEYVTEQVPPFMIVHGTGDEAVPVQQSVGFALRIREIAGSEKVTLYLAKDEPHHGNKWYTESWVTDMGLDFFDRILK